MGILLNPENVNADIFFFFFFFFNSHSSGTKNNKSSTVSKCINQEDVKDVMKTRRQAFMALLISEELDPRVDQQWINMAVVPVHKSPIAMGYHIVKDWFSESDR